MRKHLKVWLGGEAVIGEENLIIKTGTSRAFTIVKLVQFLLQEFLRDACRKAANGKVAMRVLAALLYTDIELSTCSVKGFTTRKDRRARPGLASQRLLLLHS